MKEKIENKIDLHVKSIMKKDAIDFCDYQILIGELNRIAAKEQAAKWEAEKETRMENLMKMVTSI